VSEIQNSLATLVQQYILWFWVTKSRISQLPLRTGTCYIRDIFVLFLQDYCALQEKLMKINFTLAVATLCAFNDVTSSHAHSLCSEIWLL